MSGFEGAGANGGGGTGVSGALTVFSVTESRLTASHGAAASATITAAAPAPPHSSGPRLLDQARRARSAVVGVGGVTAGALGGAVTVAAGLVIRVVNAGCGVTGVALPEVVGGSSWRQAAMFCGRSFSAKASAWSIAFSRRSE
jgi:hypothetical protein